MKLFKRLSSGSNEPANGDQLGTSSPLGSVDAKITEQLSKSTASDPQSEVARIEAWLKETELNPAEKDSPKLLTPDAKTDEQLAETFLGSTLNFQNPEFDLALSDAQNTLDVSQTPKVSANDGPIAEKQSETEHASANPEWVQTNEQTADVDIPDVPSPRLATAPRRRDRVDIGELRVDVARITSDIESGENLYRRAHQRVQNLMDYVERAEVDFSLLDRLEPENRRLKAEMRTLSADSEAAAERVSALEIDLEAATERGERLQGELDTLRTQYTSTTTALAERERRLAEIESLRQALSVKLERSATAAEIETRENAALRNRLEQLSTSHDALASERLDLAKIVESLQIDVDDHRARAEQGRAVALELRRALEAAKRVNTQMKTQLVTVHREIKAFKTQHESSTMARDDEVVALHSRINELQAQLAAKDDGLNGAAHDLSELRKERTRQELEIERLNRLVETQDFQIERARNEAANSRAETADMDRRYRDVTAALSVHQARPKFDEITDIAQAPPMPKDAVGLRAVESDPDVEDMITDFALGLRSNLNQA